jgi:hypothetical protein
MAGWARAARRAHVVRERHYAPYLPANAPSNAPVNSLPLGSTPHLTLLNAKDGK